MTLRVACREIRQQGIEPCDKRNMPSLIEFVETEVCRTICPTSFDTTNITDTNSKSTQVLLQIYSKFTPLFYFTKAWHSSLSATSNSAASCQLK